MNLAALAVLTVLCVGDSHTDWPVGNPNTYCEMSVHSTTNVAIASTDVIEWRDNWAAWTAGEVQGVDVVSILLGGGSAFLNPPRSRSEWGVAMRELLDGVPHGRIVLSSSAPALMISQTYNNALAGYAAEARIIASERENVTYGLDLVELLGLPPTCPYDDLLHPGAVCHALIAGPMSAAWVGAEPVPTGSGAGLALLLAALGFRLLLL